MIYTLLALTTVFAEDHINKVPSVLRDTNDPNVWLGLLGPCGKAGFLNNYLREDELYFCGMAGPLVEWAQTQEDEMCTFGLAEIIPGGFDSDDWMDYVFTEEQDLAMDGLSKMCINAMKTYIGREQTVMFAGTTPGAARYQEFCSSSGDPRICKFAASSMKYAGAGASFKIDDQLEQHMLDWHRLKDRMHHGQNLAYADKLGAQGAWIQKIVRCDDLPVRGRLVFDDISSPGHYGFEELLQDWLDMESLWTPTKDNIDGCGFQGDAIGLHKVRYGNGIKDVCDSSPLPAEVGKTARAFQTFEERVARSIEEKMILERLAREADYERLAYAVKEVKEAKELETLEKAWRQARSKEAPTNYDVYN